MDAAKRVQDWELQASLARVLRDAEHGLEFLVMSDGRPVARIMPPAHGQPRVAGLLKGKIRMAPDFDDPLPDMLEAIERDGEP